MFFVQHRRYYCTIGSSAIANNGGNIPPVSHGTCAAMSAGVLCSFLFTETGTAYLHVHSPHPFLIGRDDMMASVE